MTRSHRRWGWFLNFGNFGDYGNSSCLHGRCCFSDYGAYVRFRAITGDLLPSAYSISSVFQRCWGWFLNFGNSGDYGNFGNSPCLRASVVGVAFPITALTCDSARPVPALPWITGDLLP